MAKLVDVVSDVILQTTPELIASNAAKRVSHLAAGGDVVSFKHLKRPVFGADHDDITVDRFSPTGETLHFVEAKFPGDIHPLRIVCKGLPPMPQVLV